MGRLVSEEKLVLERQPGQRLGGALSCAEGQRIERCTGFSPWNEFFAAELTRELERSRAGFSEAAPARVELRSVNGQRGLSCSVGTGRPASAASLTWGRDPGPSAQQPPSGWDVRVVRCECRLFPGMGRNVAGMTEAETWVSPGSFLCVFYLLLVTFDTQRF